MTLPPTDTSGHPADLLQGKRPDVVERYYDEGIISSYVGMTHIWMRVADPGRYYDAQGREVSERDAQRAGFNIQYYRGQRRAQSIQAAAKAHADKIRAESAEHLKTEEDKRRERAEALRAEAEKVTAKVVRAAEKRSQREADKQRTSWLDAETPIPHS